MAKNTIKCDVCESLCGKVLFTEISDVLTFYLWSVYFGIYNFSLDSNVDLRTHTHTHTPNTKSTVWCLVIYSTTASIDNFTYLLGGDFKGCSIGVSLASSQCGHILIYLCEERICTKALHSIDLLPVWNVGWLQDHWCRLYQILQRIMLLLFVFCLYVSLYMIIVIMFTVHFYSSWMVGPHIILYTPSLMSQISQNYHLALLPTYRIQFHWLKRTVTND